VLPVIWFGWQLLSAAQTVDARLTALALGQFGGCVVCYFVGLWVLRGRQVLPCLLTGLLAAFVFCLIRAAEQKLFEFRWEQAALIEGERVGWTNFTPEVLDQLKRERIVIHTNGIDVASPIILAKYEKGRVHGTLVYPNALAGAVLLLYPVALAAAVQGTRRFRVATRFGVLGLALFLGCGALYWSGSKLGWLLAVAILGLWLFRLQWSHNWKWVVMTVAVAGGLTLFVVRFHGYLASGAASVGARLDYWRAATRIACDHPIWGTGPGTFQRPYARMKAPEAEMARLVHNDYLEQFSDSGVPGGLCYGSWIVLALVVAGRRLWRSAGPLWFAVFAGLLGWFLQGLGEFGLYVPALAWPAFTLLGCAVAAKSNGIDNPGEPGYSAGHE
jgi:hypothetical protein